MVSDAPSGLLTLPHSRGRCSRSQRAPQQAGGQKLHTELLFLSFQSRKEFLFSLLRVKSSQTSPPTGQLNQPGWGFDTQTVHCTSTFDSNTLEQRNYLKLAHFDVVSLFTEAGTKEPPRRERGAPRTWRSSTLWVKHLLLLSTGHFDCTTPTCPRSAANIWSSVVNLLKSRIVFTASL